MILHIPHSSIIIPSKEGFVKDNSIIDHEVNLITDWYTDDLFESKEAKIVKADFSRIFCDVERFPDDKDEVMSKYGMGVLYEKTDKGRLLREVSSELKESILRDYYYPQ